MGKQFNKLISFNYKTTPLPTKSFLKINSVCSCISGRGGLQTTRVKGSNIVRTVSGKSNQTAAQRRQAITAPGSGSVTRTISVPTGAGGPVRRVANNVRGNRGGPYSPNQGQQRTIVRQTSNVVRQQPQQQARPAVVRQAQ